MTGLTYAHFCDFPKPGPTYCWNCWSSLIKWMYKQWWSTILSISTKQTITSHLYSLHKKMEQWRKTLESQVLAWDRNEKKRFFFFYKKAYTNLFFTQPSHKFEVIRIISTIVRNIYICKIYLKELYIILKSIIKYTLKSCTLY